MIIASLVGAFNQEKALGGAFSVIVKTSGTFVWSSTVLPQSSSGGVTKISCAEVGPYIGNSSLGNITVVDTPGFGVNIEEEEQAIEQLAAWGSRSHDRKYLLLFLVSDTCEMKGGFH